MTDNHENSKILKMSNTVKQRPDNGNYLRGAWREAWWWSRRAKRWYRLAPMTTSSGHWRRRRRNRALSVSTAAYNTIKPPVPPRRQPRRIQQTCYLVFRFIVSMHCACACVQCSVGTAAITIGAAYTHSWGTRTLREKLSLSLTPSFTVFHRAVLVQYLYAIWRVFCRFIHIGERDPTTWSMRRRSSCYIYNNSAFHFPYMSFSLPLFDRLSAHTRT